MGNNVCCDERMVNQGEEYRYSKFTKYSKQSLLENHKQGQSSNSEQSGSVKQFANSKSNDTNNDDNVINLVPYRQSYKKTSNIRSSQQNNIQPNLSGKGLKKNDPKQFRIRTATDRSEGFGDDVSIIAKEGNQNNKQGHKQFLDGESMFKDSSNLLNFSFEDYKKQLRSKQIKQLPYLTQEAISTAQYLNLFDVNLQDLEYLKYGKEFFHGSLHPEYPHGIGRFFKENGSLYIGNFVLGRANGEGIYIFPDGSYYQGIFKANKANDENGLYRSKRLMYVGAFVDNCFDGQGTETGISHTFKGRYRKNKKIKGLLKWKTGKQEYLYQGTFNENGQFEGTGTLNQPKGTYTGEFVNGVKHGKATYAFRRGLKYVGQYVFGQRQGQGKLYNVNQKGQQKLAYQGQFKKGLPDGKGEVPLANGKLIQTTWVQGVDSQTLI